jgi:hypothetical protein
VNKAFQDKCGVHFALDASLACLKVKGRKLKEHLMICENGQKSGMLKRFKLLFCHNSALPQRRERHVNRLPCVEHFLENKIS